MRFLTDTAWAFSALHFFDHPLCNAISAEAIKKINDIETSGLCTLVDVNLQCHEVLESLLGMVIEWALDAFPATMEDWTVDAQLHAIESLQVDNFGFAGTRFALDCLGIPEASAHFNTRAASRCQSHARRSSGPMAGLRRFVFAECHLACAVSCGGRQDGQVLDGELLKEGCYARTNRAPSHSRPGVVCSASAGWACCDSGVMQLLDDLLGAIGDAEGGHAVTDGAVDVYVTGPPCISCLGVFRQLQLTLPRVAVAVTVGRHVGRD